jgi:pyruvate dehydrogenase E2 component (dihydrolipoamide acetyltransferase)
MTFAPAQAAGEDIEIPVAGKRAVIAKRLAESKFSAPHYYLKNSVEMESLIAARNMVNKEVPSKVSFNAFIMKMVAEALKRHPQVNAGWYGDKIVQFGSIDIGLAVDLGNGLITPIVRNVGNKGVVQIDSELKVLIEKVGNGSLKPDEYTGATFSISNLGSFGVEEFTAIINPPGSAILALGEVKKTPVFDENGELKAANLMKMTLSCDHRVIDGALGGKFLSELKKTIESPVRVLF